MSTASEGGDASGWWLIGGRMFVEIVGHCEARYEQLATGAQVDGCPLVHAWSTFHPKTWTKSAKQR